MLPKAGQRHLSVRPANFWRIGETNDGKTSNDAGSVKNNATIGLSFSLLELEVVPVAFSLSNFFFRQHLPLQCSWGRLRFSHRFLAM